MNPTDIHGMALALGLPSALAQIEAVKQLVAEAVAAEREACAVIAEEWFCGCGRGKCPEGDLRAQDIANSIRARGEA
jgi:hypothetical protein